MKPSRLLLSTLLGALLGGCSDEELAPQITPVDGLPDDLPATVLDEAASLERNLDTDGDGLPDIDELVGWPIRIDATGRPQGILERWVTSDPDNDDTDGDGLIDGRERQVGSDPNLNDTDGDGLSDLDEVVRWATSPVSVDSDADSRGQNPDPSSAPNASLFDGAELRLTPDPEDASTMIAGPLATNPLQADTDGDGVWDGAENGTPTRQATIAEVPRLVVAMSPQSTAGLYLNLTITEGQTTTEEVGEELSFAGGASTTLSNSTSYTLSLWAATMTKIGAILNIDASTEQAGADAGVHFETEIGAGIKHSLYTEFAVDTTLSTSFSQVYSEVEALGRDRTQTIDGGRITLLVDVVNTSKVPCVVRGLTMQLMRFDPFAAGGRGATRPVALLRPTVDTDIVLAAGEPAPVQMEARGVDARRMIGLLQNPRLMVLVPATYDVFTAGDDDYTFIESDVADRTARITLDLGGGDVRVYDVAAQTGRAPDGTPTGVSVAEVLDRVGIPWDADPIPQSEESLLLQRYVFKVGDSTTELYTGAPPSLNDPLPIPPDLDPGPRLIKRGWFALIERKSGKYEFDERLFSARLMPGDKATLLMLEDLDRDGLPASEERLRGTSDADLDSDRDGLSDYWEIRVGWDVTVVGEPTVGVYPSPSSNDSDGDGLLDKDELLAGTHPWLVDTDRDGMNDKAELDAGRDPLEYNDQAPVITQCGDPAGGYLSTKRFTANDADGDLVEVTITWNDGIVTRIPLAATPTWSGKVVRDRTVTRVEARDRRGNTTTACVP